MDYSITVWKAAVWGLVILVINMAVGNLLYMKSDCGGDF